MVLLRHDLPDGSWHFDWMLDLEGARTVSGVSPGLVAFRVWERPETVPIGEAIRAERLKHHRREYLTYEGEVSGGRGHVKRLLTGRSTVISEGAGGCGAGGVLEFEAAFDGVAPARWRAREAGVVWEITRFA